ncbi:MAG TPA: radical SAM protein [Bryobacteraceae bacterium]|nr:radical SAM protein [Bryobacteraceae bacterium]
MDDLIAIGGCNPEIEPGAKMTAISAALLKHLLFGFLDLSGVTLAAEVVASCNLVCPGCWVGKARPDMFSKANLDIMPESIFDAALNFGRQLNIEKLSLLGGEPTMRADLPVLIQRGRDKGYTVGVTSNGVCSTERLKAVLAAGLQSITFSIDGASAATHDRLRPSRGGQSTFEITLRGIRQAVLERDDHGYAVVVNHTIYPANLEEAEAMVRLSAALGVDRIRLHFTLPNDSNISGEADMISPQSWSQLRARMEQLASELNRPIAVAEAYGRGATAESQRRRSPYLTVQPDGRLMVCAAYSRLRDPRRHWIAKVISDGNFALNSHFVDRTRHPVCCGAVPEFISELSESEQELIDRHGGLGCIIVPSSIGGKKI